jgi:NADH-quinone oxidoreductase subunit I
MAVIRAPRPELRWWHRIYFPAIAQGLAVTMRHFFRRKVTLRFPEVRWPFPKHYRGFPQLVTGKDGIEKCVACKLCEVVCPPLAITIAIGEYRDPAQRERIPAEFTIDMGRCIVCGMCEEACPKDAIVLSDTHIMSSASRESLIFRKTLLLEDFQSIETMRP